GRLCAGPRRPGTQFKGHFTRNSSQRVGGVHRRLGVRQILIGVWNAVCRGSTPLPGIRLAICSPAVSPDGSPRGGCDRGSAAGTSAATTAWIANDEVVGRKRHHVVEPATDAVLPRRRLPSKPAVA